MIHNRTKILEYFSGQGDKALAARLLDLCEEVLRAYEPQYTDFLDPSQLQMARSLLNSISEVGFCSFGGYANAERCRLVIFPDYLTEDIVEQPLAYVNVMGKFQFQAVTHRDFLGALLNLGIKREKFGDLLVYDDGCDLIMVPEVVTYVTSNLTKVGRIGISTKVIDQKQLHLPQISTKDVSGTVASLRMDAVLAQAFGLSRSQAAKDIAAGQVKVNWQDCTDASQLVQAGDMFSLRGKGRAKLVEVNGPTKKGRIGVRLERYL